MKLTYIYHSGFAIEASNCNIVVDYFKDPAKVMENILKSPKPLYVLASHFHPDHFSPEILEWKECHHDATYILSKDILRHRRAPKEAALWLSKGGDYSDGNLCVRAFGSTDSGVSFLIKTGEKLLFHAGDLNNWHWQDESTDAETVRAEAMYLGELKDIMKVVTAVDVAMFPVDARIGSGYMRGASQFVKRISTSLFVPMHFTASGFDSANAFAHEAEENGCCFWNLHNDGESMEI